MSMISSTKANKAEANQLVKQSAVVAESTSAEGSLLEEFSQILDKIADQLARGHKDSETIDLLAIEQAAERVQAQVAPQAPRLNEATLETGNEFDGAVERDDTEGDTDHADRGDARGLNIDDAAGESLEQATTQEGKSEENTELHSFEAEVVEAQSRGSLKDATPEAVEQVVESSTASTDVAGGEAAVLSAKDPSADLQEMKPSLEQELPVVSAPPSVPTMAAAQAPTAVRVSSSESSRVSTETITTATPASPIAPAVTAMKEELTTAPTEMSRQSQDIGTRTEIFSGGVSDKALSSEKAIPFTTFMLQGNGFAGSGISRDVVAQAILRPALDSALGRQVNEIAASGKGGAQSGMGGFGNDASLLRGAGNQVKNDGAARALKALPRAIAARTLEKVERALEEVARSKDGKTISLHLEPVTLGKVKVDVSLRDGNLHARLSAEAGEVQQLLREHAHELQAILRKSGLHVDSVSVSVGTESGTFEGSSDLYGQESFSERSEREGDGETGSFSTQPEVAESGRPAVVADDHWVA